MRRLLVAVVLLMSGSVLGQEVTSVVPGSILAPSDGSSVSNEGFQLYFDNGSFPGQQAVESAVICRLDEQDWWVAGAFGALSPIEIGDTAPGTLVECKVRSRLTGYPGIWADSAPFVFQTGGSFSQPELWGLLAGVPPYTPACSAFELVASVRNNGNRTGYWRVNACITDPATESCDGVDAVWPSMSQVVLVGAGNSTEAVFQFDGQVFLDDASNPSKARLWVEDLQGNPLTPPSDLDVFRNDTVPAQVSVAGFGASTEGFVARGQALVLDVDASDDVSLREILVWWRPAGGSWFSSTVDVQPLECDLEYRSLVDFTVPGFLADGSSIELRVDAVDHGGHVSSASLSYVIGDSAPQVAFIRPGATAVATLVADEESCLDTEFVVSAASEPDVISFYWTDSAGNRRVDLELAVEARTGRQAVCVPFRTAGDAVVLGMDVRIDGVVESFQSPPFAVNYGSDLSDWSNVKVFVSQGSGDLPLSAQDGVTTTRFHGLGRTTSGFSLFRQDATRWTESGGWYEAHEVRMLKFSLPGILLSGIDAVLPITVASVAANAGPLTLELPRWTNWFFQQEFRVVEPCSDPDNAPCDRELWWRSVLSGALTAWEKVGLWDSVEPDAVPLADGILGDVFLDSSDVPTISLGWAGSVVDFYQRAGGMWSLKGRQTGVLERECVISGVALGVETTGNPEVTGLSVRTFYPSEGVLGASPFSISANEPIAGWDLVSAPDGETGYLVAVLANSLQVRAGRVLAGSWSDLGTFPLPPTLDGEDYTLVSVGSMAAYQGGVVLNLRVVTEGGQSKTALIALDAYAGILDENLVWSRFPIDFADRTAMATNDARVVMVVPDCRWNLRPTLCLRVSRPLTSCEDDDGCTVDRWSFDQGKCLHSPMFCPDDGDHCNGPEQCDPSVGACVSATEFGPVCTDGKFCNGLEWCDPSVYVCLPGTPPEIDDATACTLDFCDEQTDMVRHVVDDDLCLMEPCQSGTCAPEAPAADLLSGCVAGPSPVPEDGLSCTQESCQNGAVFHTPQVGACVISGACVLQGAARPQFPCEKCFPTIDAWTYSAAMDGEPCEDGAFCSEGDSCDGGVCVPGEARDCSTGSECSEGYCEESSSSCKSTNVLSGTPCGAATVCEEGQLTVPSACDGQGQCLSSSGYVRDCAPYAGCGDAQSCASSCDGQEDCSENAVCDDGLCRTNEPPVADAGSDQTVDEGELVTLNGSFSWDEEGAPLTYRWTQLEGPLATLDDSSVATPQFTAPSTGADTFLVFRLVVSDGFADSDPGDTRVNVRNVLNDAPIADAGEDQVVREGETVLLDGRGSLDPNQDPLTFSWSVESGSAVEFDDPTSTTPSFTAPVTGQSIGLTLVLVVNDGQMNSEPDRVLISVLAAPDEREEEVDLVSEDSAAQADTTVPYTPPTNNNQQGADPYDPLSCSSVPTSGGPCPLVPLALLLALAGVLWGVRRRIRRM